MSLTETSLEQNSVGKKSSAMNKIHLLTPATVIFKVPNSILSERKHPARPKHIIENFFILHFF